MRRDPCTRAYFKHKTVEGKSLKEIHCCQFKTLGERVLFQYIEIYYNRQRKHSTNGCKFHADYESKWW